MQDVIKDIAPAVEIVRPFPWVYVSIGVIVLLLLFVLWFIYKRRHKKPVVEQQPPPIPAEQEALQALEQLKFSDAKQYYIELSNIVRRFIERRFDLNATEQTTEEFLINASRSSLLNDANRQMLETFLREADMVKFAKHQVSPSHAENSAKGLKQFFLEEYV